MSIKDRDNILKDRFQPLLERVQKAINFYNMINKGDKVLVAVSGGKDSLSMMHILDYFSKNRIYEFELLACNVDLGYGCANKDVLKNHMDTYGIKHIFVENDILNGKTREEIGCFWCSWNRRKTLFETVDSQGCNKLSLGHHLDDIINTALLNILFHGEISTSPPYLTMFNGAFTLIRPLCYIKEEETEELAQALKIPLPCCSCPHKPGSKRTFISQTLEPIFKNFPEARCNVLKALAGLKKNR